MHGADVSASRLFLAGQISPCASIMQAEATAAHQARTRGGRPIGLCRLTRHKAANYSKLGSSSKSSLTNKRSSRKPRKRSRKSCERKSGKSANGTARWIGITTRRCSPAPLCILSNGSGQNVRRAGELLEPGLEGFGGEHAQRQFLNEPDHIISDGRGPRRRLLWGLEPIPRTGAITVPFATPVAVAFQVRAPPDPVKLVGSWDTLEQLDRVCPGFRLDRR